MKPEENPVEILILRDLPGVPICCTHLLGVVFGAFGDILLLFARTLLICINQSIIIQLSIILSICSKRSVLCLSQTTTLSSLQFYMA